MSSDSVLAVTLLPTAPIEGQKPGTSGLRKKTRVFMAGLYLHNFIQSIFDVVPREELQGSTLVVGGDGRFYTREAVQIAIKIAAANGVRRVWVGRGGLLSTPAVSCIIREREGGVACGGIILTASHNPGGLDEDFGIKYNVRNGGPANEAFTDAVYAATRRISVVRSAEALPVIDLDTLGVTSFGDGGVGGAFSVEVIDPVTDMSAALSTIFDFPALRRLLSRPDFSLAYDGMCGVAGVYAQGILRDVLGVPPSALIHCTPLPDFGGHHPDPNLTYAPELVAAMGLTREGTPAPLPSGTLPSSFPDFGAAQDGDADRNMILGRRFFVTPSDSVAIIAAHARDAIPYFRTRGLRGLARSMPTSCALDRVALGCGIPLFEVPTGWKYFGSLMDAGPYSPFICGEESFGTGSDHVREKDGLWAVLAWLSILAHANTDTPHGSLVSVEQIVRAHWARYGRNYYCRYDYEGVDARAADALMDHLRARATAFTAAAAAASSAAGGDGVPYSEPVARTGGYALAKAEEFTYTDPVDGSVSTRQGMRFIMSDGASRAVFRLSGTGSEGATIRVYIERYASDPADHDLPTATALADLVAFALEVSQLEKFTGRKAPTVIT